MVGCVLLLDLHVVAPGLAEIAYFVAPWAQHRGIGSRAVISTVRWAAHHHGLRRLQANVDPANVISAALLAKLGLHEGKYIPASYSQFSDRSGNPRAGFIVSGSEVSLDAALATYPAEQDFTIT